MAPLGISLSLFALRSENDTIVVTIATSDKYVDKNTDFETYVKRNVENLPEKMKTKLTVFLDSLFRAENELSGDIQIYKTPKYKKRNYEDMNDAMSGEKDCFPSNYAVLGDTVCFLNPRFGQGLSAGAFGVTTLDILMRKNSNFIDVSRLHRKILAKKLILPWFLSRVVDYKIPNVEPAENDVKTKVKNSIIVWFLINFVKLATLSKLVAKIHYKIFLFRY